MRRFLLLLPALVVVLAGCSSLQGTEGKEYVGSEFQVTELTPADRTAPIESSGETIDGGTLDVADYRGRVLVVNVWWSGCGPCFTEMPLLVDAVAGFGGQADLVGINTRDISPDNAASFERGVGVDFPSIYSPGGTNLLDFGDQVDVRAMPSTIVLDREGRIAAVISGEIPSAQTLTSVVETVVAESADSPAAAGGA